MAQIREFTVEGLAGRSEPISIVLNSDINVFFGLNGSGKTTLLKILHSALSTDVDIVKDLPFTRAAVKVYLNRYRREFVRTYARREQSASEEVELSVPSLQQPLWSHSDFATPVSLSELPPNLLFDYKLNAVVEAPKWSSDPPEPDGKLTTHGFGFLPISRLYRNLRTARGSVFRNEVLVVQNDIEK